MIIDRSKMMISPSSFTQRHTADLSSDQGQPSPGVASNAQVVAASANQEESGARFGLPYPPPAGWLEAQAALHEREAKEKGIIMTDQIRFINPTEEEQLEFMRQKQADAARDAAFRYAVDTPSIKENHDTTVPNIAGLSLKWANVVRGVVEDLVKHPGPGTLYGGYGDKTTSSATELLGWIDDYIAKLSADPKDP